MPTSIGNATSFLWRNTRELAEVAHVAVRYVLPTVLGLSCVAALSIAEEALRPKRNSSGGDGFNPQAHP